MAYITELLSTHGPIGLETIGLMSRGHQIVTSQNQQKRHPECEHYRKKRTRKIHVEKYMENPWIEKKTE